MLIIGWNNIPTNRQVEYKPDLFVSVIVVVKNEIDNIHNLLESIEKQTYNKDFFEVIVVNDASNDGTLELLYHLEKSLKINLVIIDLKSNNSNTSGKKLGISKAITASKGTFILATDGDCIVGVKWIETYVNCYKANGYKFISGPVTFFSNTFFDKLQIVEFASLIGTGAASIQLNRPNMCNGANLGYEKNAYLQVNGFDSYDYLPSGDDEFLMHKINQLFPSKLGFLKDVNAIVKTNAQPNLYSFYNQRKRWAGKWNKYLDRRNSILAIFIFFVNLWSIIGIIYLFLGSFQLIFHIVFFIKIAFELFFIGSVLTFFGDHKKIFLIPIVQIIYPFYVVFTALNSYSKSYEWKGRIYKN